jgi:hypothetical protein
MARVREREVDRSGPNWKAYDEAVGGGEDQ